MHHQTNMSEQTVTRVVGLICNLASKATNRLDKDYTPESIYPMLITDLPSICLEGSAGKGEGA